MRIFLFCEAFDLVENYCMISYMDPCVVYENRLSKFHDQFLTPKMQVQKNQMQEQSSFVFPARENRCLIIICVVLAQ